MFDAYMIIDGQWGSTGKGLLCGYLAKKMCPDTVISNFGPNAGHTFVEMDGTIKMTQIMPTGAVVNNDNISRIMLGPGAIIDVDILYDEIHRYLDIAFIRDIDFVIHERASLVMPRHRDFEKNELERISSTCKGTGAAQAEKVLRKECIMKYIDKDIVKKIHPFRVIDDNEWMNLLYKSKLIQIETAQGFELGLNTGLSYPYCTARDITPWQALSDCAIPRMMMRKCLIYVTLRTYPIRVGNVYDEAGNIKGWSGPVYKDQEEITWEEIGQKAERTTVTQKIRRIFTFSYIGFRRMVERFNPDAVFLNFVNYLEPNPNFNTFYTKNMIETIEKVYEETVRINCAIPNIPLVRWIGTGPRYDNVLER